MQHPLKDALGPVVQAAVALLPGRAQEPAAQHGGEGQRHKTGHQDGRSDGHREFVQQPAQDAAQKEHRDKHRGQGQGHGEDGEADLPGAVDGRCKRRLPHLHVPDDVFQHHDGIVHHKADAQDQGHEGEVVQAVIQQVHDREGPDDGQGQRQAGDNGGREIPQEEKDHHDHQPQGQQQGELDIVHRFPDGDGAVVQGNDLHRGRDLVPDGGQQLIDGVHHLDGVGARLALDGQDNGPGGLVPGSDLVVGDAVDHPADLRQAHGLAAPVGHNEGPVGVGGGELPGGHHRHRLVGAIQGAGGQVDVFFPHRLGHLVDPQPPAGQGLGVQLDPHGVLLLPVDQDLGHPVDHGDALGHEGVGILVDRGQGQGLGGNRQVENRLVRGINLLVGRRGGHVRGQSPGGLADGRLHVLGGAVQTAAQVELEGDLGEPQGVGGTHGVQAGDGGELALQGGGHRRGHGLGGGPGEVGGYRDGGKIDVGQIAHRQIAIAHGPEQQDRQHDQGGHDRPADEELGEVH